MIGMIQRGVGAPGKLWTGDIPEHGAICTAVLIERTCACGRSTRKLRATPLSVLRGEASSAAEWPTLFVTMGGVGSLVTAGSPRDLIAWNWSGRAGGHVIVNPLAVAGGYVNKDDLPPAREGFAWHQTYGGSTLAEYVLLREDLASHTVPVVALDGTCPPCREKADPTWRWVSDPVGSRGASLCVELRDGELWAETGCWHGRLADLPARAIATHGEGSQHAVDYARVVEAAQAAFATRETVAAKTVTE